MGKQRVEQLLAQLKETEAKDIENAAAIYTVAQVAVNALEQPQLPQLEPAGLPVVSIITKSELLDRYGSFNGCRKAAKKLGIKFSKTPSWQKLEAAFSYREACQKLIKNYLETYPSEHLQGISLDIPLHYS